MLIRLSCALAALGLLAACESRRPAEPPAATRPAAQDSVATPAALALPVDTTDLSQTLHGYEEGRDTSFRVGGQNYRLLLRADTDSTKPLLATTEGIVGGAFADDTSSFAQSGRVRGYEGGHTISLLDPTGRQLFRRRLRKQDFFGVASPDIVTVSNPARPRFLGYHAPSQTLAFVLGIGIPGSDVGQQCIIVLGFDGRVRRLLPSYQSNWSAADCSPRLLPDGTLLTCEGLIWPGGLAHLGKVKAELIAAFPLTDSTLFTMYRYGEYRERPDEASGLPPTEVSAGFHNPEWVPDPQMRRSPNAFIINTRGRVRLPLFFRGYDEAIGYYVPRAYVWQAQRYYLLDDDGSVLVLNKQNPRDAVRVRRRQLQAFRAPRRPAELRFELASTTAGSFAFYVDPAQPTRLRYQRID
ncbi:hypothetical protein EJV47_15975 [Hymenobacter gummosus]|uniref:DUF4221 domain-containing protein n=1 Tax=Hymenobacter gummosus TaxID=1776032 RepID=A0A3S0H3W1_9BACT|nr:hypothetical protein [Hymenobacter gummosus]RTQ48469.1 hypothetical protein EJV47_15975 [Hymenobacter gummosus]